MKADEIKNLAEIFEKADLVMVQIGDKKAGFGADCQQVIVDALKFYHNLKLSEEMFPELTQK